MFFFIFQMMRLGKSKRKFTDVRQFTISNWQDNNGRGFISRKFCSTWCFIRQFFLFGNRKQMRPKKNINFNRNSSYSMFHTQSIMLTVEWSIEHFGFSFLLFTVTDLLDAHPICSKCGNVVCITTFERFCWRWNLCNRSTFSDR